MKATGVIRRIDDLGRIVIPKEIRKNLRIKSGENLEIFVDEKENVILRKYNQIDKLKDISEELARAITTNTKKTVLITNTENIITISGSNKRNYQEKKLSNDLIQTIYNRKDICQKEFEQIEIIQNQKEQISYALVPIIANGDLIGSVIITSKEDNLTQNDFETTKIVASFLANHIEG